MDLYRHGRFQLNGNTIGFHPHSQKLEPTFSNSSIIHKENTKECVMSVWKSDEKLLISASLISPFKIILFEK